jgi:twitching motility protein PilU
MALQISPFLKVALKMAVEKGASDVYLSPHSQIVVKIEGDHHLVGSPRDIVGPEIMDQVVAGILSEEQKAFFRKNLEIDLPLAIPDIGRFRVNVFRQRGNSAVVMRIVKDVPTFASLGLPPVLQELVMHKRGLILMVGATGSGKSTTLAAMIDHRNENITGHILTIEDPIEFFYHNKKSLINQRQVGYDTHSYMNAIRSAVREAPDVILVGEARDRETMEAAITLASTGHLSISTLHANNSYQTLQRIISMFPDDMREQLLQDLSINLRAIISQRLVKGRDGRRVAAVEVMLNSPYIAELILKGEIGGIKEQMEGSSDRGMQTFDTALTVLYKEGRIDLETALSNADSRANLESKMSFG